MKIVHIRNDGTIAITTMAKKDVTQAELLEHAKELALKNPDYISHLLIEDTRLLEDRYFRNAWQHVDGSISVHMDKAKKIHLDKLRDIRSIKFMNMGFPARLNPQVENAILDDETKLKLKELRDFPQNLDLTAITDPDVLKNTIPDCLK